MKFPIASVASEVDFKGRCRAGPLQSIPGFNDFPVEVRGENDPPVI
jgi:hypothetical protein